MCHQACPHRQTEYMQIKKYIYIYQELTTQGGVAVLSSGGGGWRGSCFAGLWRCVCMDNGAVGLAM